MPRLASPARRSWILAVALLAATGGAASVGHTQQVAGAIGVSLTILEPIAAPELRVIRFDVDRAGVARIETSLPVSTRTSPLVMTRVSSSTTGFTPEAQPPAPVTVSGGTARRRYLVNVGRDRRDRARLTKLRVEYLIVVAGT